MKIPRLMVLAAILLVAGISGAPEVTPREVLGTEHFGQSVGSCAIHRCTGLSAQQQEVSRRENLHHEKPFVGQ
jgi:hypothetical protein